VLGLKGRVQLSVTNREEMKAAVRSEGAAGPMGSKFPSFADTVSPKGITLLSRGKCNSEWNTDSWVSSEQSGWTMDKPKKDTQKKASKNS